MSILSGKDQPVFKNGAQTLNQFLETNMVYPLYSKNNCIQGVIKVEFQLTKTGEVVHSRVKEGLGIDLDEEALRLIQLTNQKWIVPKDFSENTEIVIPVKFSLKNYNCENRSKPQIEKAIALYQSRQTMENVVTSYYQNKIAGTVSGINEEQINQLKADLGFDDDLVAEKLEDAQKMLNQGDKSGACKILNFIKHIGYTNADTLIEQNCK
ncbi:MAG TPA: energy transducer TonB [Pelobium sp.]